MEFKRIHKTERAYVPRLDTWSRVAVIAMVVIAAIVAASWYSCRGRKDQQPPSQVPVSHRQNKSYPNNSFIDLNS